MNIKCPKCSSQTHYEGGYTDTKDTIQNIAYLTCPRCGWVRHLGTDKKKVAIELMGGFDKSRYGHLAKGKYAKNYRGHTLEDLSKLLDIPVGTLEAWKTHYV